MEYEKYDALALAQLIKEKKISAKELLTIAIERAHKINPKLNAITHWMLDAAESIITENKSHNGPFSGVPFLLKDLGTRFKGTVTTNGSRFYADFIPDHHSESVNRFLNAGFVIFGKTNTPEFGLNYTTESEFLKPCHNPWDLTLTPGGSSGGAAAAVAARLVPMAHASDGGGSIRVPASCCGLFGLKPSRGRATFAPDAGEAWSGLATYGCISVSVRDSAALLDVISGYYPGDPYTAPKPEQSFLYAATHEKLKPLKIAFSTMAPAGIKLDSDCIQAVINAAKLCESLGHQVSEDHYLADYQLLAKTMAVIVTANLQMNLNQRAKTLGRTLKPDDVEAMTWLLYQTANQFSAQDYACALLDMHTESRKILQFFENYDVLITPVTAMPAVSLGKLTQSVNNLSELFESQRSFAPFTTIYNQTGQPAMSVPLHWTDKGIPIGVQFIGKYAEEATLLNLASQLEKARPWQNKIPD